MYFLSQSELPPVQQRGLRAALEWEQVAGRGDGVGVMHAGSQDGARG